MKRILKVDGFYDFCCKFFFVSIIGTIIIKVTIIMLIFLKNYFIIGDWCQIRFFLVIDFYPIFAEKPRVPKNVIWSIPWLYIFTQRNICIINVEDIIYAHIFHSEAPHDICFATFWSSEFSYSFGKLSDQPQLR